MNKKTKAIIFDMDGVISDTQVLHSRIEHEIFKEHDIEMHPDEIERRYAGVSLPVIFNEVFDEHDKDMPPVEGLVGEKWNRMNSEARGNIQAVPGSIEFIEQLYSKDLPLAVASASSKDFILSVLNELSIKDKFQAAVSSEEVERGKPAPDIFLLAAERLSAEPETCIVIEDGISGLVGAGKAGMRTIGLVRGENKNKDDYPADIIVDDLRKVSQEFLSI